MVDVVVVLAWFLLGAVAVGALWPQLVDPVVVEVTEAGVVTGEVALGDRFDTVGWYVLLAVATGILLGAVLVARRRAQEVVTVVAVLVGACVAAWLSARVGTWLGPEDARQALRGAEVGTTAEEPIVLPTDAAYLAWPIAAMMGAVAVLWSRSGRGEPPAPRQQRDGLT